MNSNILDGSKNTFQFNFPQFPENLSEISSKMSDSQRKEYEEMAKRTQFFSEMYKLMTARMAESQQIHPTNLFKDLNGNQGHNNSNNTNNNQSINDKEKIINSKTFNKDNHSMKYTNATSNNSNNMINNKINNSEQKQMVMGISNKNNTFLNSYYKTPNKKESNPIFNNNNNFSNNKIYSIIDTKNNNTNNNNNKQNYDGMPKINNNNNILQDPNQNKFLDDLFD